MMGAGEGQQGKSDRLTAGMGILLMVTAALITLPGVTLVTLGSDNVQSSGFRMVAWSAAIFLFVAGALLVCLRRRLSGVNLLLLAGSVVFAILLAEGVLALAGVHPPCHLVFRVPELSPSFLPDREVGTRMVRGHFKPGWPINEDGFSDSDEFLPVHPGESNARILFIGDSFTLGVNASNYTTAFVSILENTLQQETRTIVWNTGIPGTGQPEHWLYLQTYFPRLLPQIVILPFCTNDFSDNFFPPGACYVFQPNTWLNRYAVDAAGNFIVLSPEQAYRRAMRHPKETSDYLALSRVGHLLVSALSRVFASHRAPAGPNTIAEEPCSGYEQTKGLLIQIRDYVASHNARFLLVPIPFAEDLDEPSECYRAIVRLCGELDIDCVEVRDRLENADYSTADRHWNDQGHKKVADALLPLVRQLLKL